MRCKSRSCCCGAEAGDEPIGLRRYYHRHFGYHARFHLAVVVTLLVVAYALVPRVAHFLSALGGYNPAAYEPKDAARQVWIGERGSLLLPHVPIDLAINVLLFLLVAIVWLALVPPGASRRR